MWETVPRFGNMLLEQFGGANGELSAAMQYSSKDCVGSCAQRPADGIDTFVRSARELTIS